MGTSDSTTISSAGAVKVAPVEAAFQHDALLYKGEEEFLHGVLPFVNEALAADEPVMVAVREARATLLANALGGNRDRVTFLDIERVGRNPACIIPAWQEFVTADGIGERAVRGVGEPAWPGRSTAELDECERHESLLNSAFADGPRWQLLCPYDAGELDAHALEAARRTHPTLLDDGVSRENDRYLAGAQALAPYAGELSPPGKDLEELAFTTRGIGAVRGLVSKRATRAGLGDEAREDLVLAINELVTNSVQYAGGGGTLAIWREEDALVCEVRDRGQISNPLAGRVPPPLDQHSGRGLWLVNHLCDLVQIRSAPGATVVRTRMLLERG